MKINIAICDDNEAYICQLKDMIKECNKNGVNSYCIYSFLSGKILLEKIKNHFNPDIIFLDIDLRESMLGTSFGIEIKKMNPDILLVYISLYTDYYKELAQAEPFCFLSKPIETNEIEDALNRAIKRIYYIKQHFIYKYKTNGIVNKIDLKDVLYFESQHRVINIHTRKGEICQFYGKLDTIETEVEEIYPYFLRINKSYYVNYNYIDYFSSTKILIQGMVIKISAKYKNKFLDKMPFL